MRLLKTTIIILSGVAIGGFLAANFHRLQLNSWGTTTYEMNPNATDGEKYALYKKCKEIGGRELVAGPYGKAVCTK